MNCQRCASTIPTDSKFCPNCGFAFGSDATQQLQPSQFQPQQPPPGSYPYGSDSNSYYHAQPGFQAPPEPMPGAKGKAIAAFVLALVALIIPIPVLDIIAGVIALVLQGIAKRDGYNTGFRTAALVLGIIGTIVAISFTIGVFRGTSSSPWF